MVLPSLEDVSDVDQLLEERIKKPRQLDGGKVRLETLNAVMELLHHRYVLNQAPANLPKAWTNKPV